MKVLLDTVYKNRNQHLEIILKSSIYIYTYNSYNIIFANTVYMNIKRFAEIQTFANLHFLITFGVTFSHFRAGLSQHP